MWFRLAGLVCASSVLFVPRFLSFVFVSLSGGVRLAACFPLFVSLSGGIRLAGGGIRLAGLVCLSFPFICLPEWWCMPRGFVCALSPPPLYLSLFTALYVFP